MIAVFAIGWVACSAVLYGLWVNHFQNKFPTIADMHRIDDRIMAGFFALLGPISLFSFLLTRFVFLPRPNPPLRWKL